MKITERKHISVQDFDKLVVDTYGRPYSFQQQDGCKDRGVEYVTIPDEPEDYDADECETRVYGASFGVSFAAWLARDPAERFCRGVRVTAGWTGWSRRHATEPNVVI